MGRIKRGMSLLSVVPLVIAGLVMSGATSAAVIQFDLDFEFSGATAPSGDAPWLRVTFDDEDLSGSVTLTLQDLNLTGTEFVTGWYLNFNPERNPDTLNFTHDSGVMATDVATGANAFKADGDGYFDILFSFPNSGAGLFGENSTSVYTITGFNDLSANMFEFVSVNGSDPEKNGFLSAAKIQGIGEGGEESGWIAPSNGDEPGGPPAGNVPEPGIVLLFGAGLLAIGVQRRREVPRF